MDNLDVALCLHEIADFLELKGEDPFKVRAYRQAACTVATLTEDLAAIHRRGELGKLPGFGKAISAKVAELLDTGRLEYLETLRAAVPPGLRELTRVRGLGARTAALLHARLGIASLEELELAAREGRLRDLPGFGVKKEAAILRELQARHRRAGMVPAYRMWELARAVARWLEGRPGVAAAAVAGALRRMAVAVPGEAVVVVAAADPAAVVGALDRCPGVRAVAPDRFAHALLWETGSEGHLRALGERAAALGLSLDEGGLTGPDGAPVPAAGEADLYARLGLQYVPPELREGAGEVAAALRGELPRLVDLTDIRGDLHIHTRWSDGTATVAEMAAARARGHAYLGICDHSRSLRVAGGLTPERLAAQGEEIAAVGRTLDGIRLLKGSEVDILRDGSLDFPDEVLAGLDVVVAAVHSAFDLDAEAQTRRLEAAIRNPHVDIIGHPTGRRLGYRDPYPLDLDRIFRLAAETGTALELSASPERLDLGGEEARLARSYGVRFAINTDAHSPAELDLLAWGVGQARRAGLTAAEVVNALPLPALEEWLRRPKG